MQQARHKTIKAYVSYVTDRTEQNEDIQRIYFSRDQDDRDVQQ